MTYGLTQEVRVSVADFFSNPVAPNVQVQFQSDFAEVAGSAVFTKDAAEDASSASINITTGPPETVDGFVTISAQTIGGVHAKVLSLAIDPNNSNIVYAGTDTGGVFKTTDGGASWKNVGTPLKDIGPAKFTNLTGTMVRDLVIDPNNSGTIYAATEDGVFVSINSGEDWETITGLKRIIGDNLGTASGAAPNVQNLGEAFSFSFQSTGLRSRTKIFVNGVQTVNYIFSGSGIRFIGGLAGGSVISADYDTDSILPSGLPIYAVAVDPSTYDNTLQHAQTIYAGVYGDGVYKTVNGGRSWLRSSTMAAGSGVNFGENVLCLAINNSSPWEVMAGTDGDGLFMTANGAQTWTKLTGTAANPINESVVQDVVFLDASSWIWIGGKNGVHYSTDGGATWNVPVTNVSAADPTNTDVRGLARDSVDGILYAATFGDVLDKSSPHGGVYTSADWGANWSKLPDASSNAGTNFIDALAVYGQSGADIVMVGNEGRAIFRSGDSGSSWTQVNGTQPDNLTNLLFDSAAVMHSGPLVVTILPIFADTVYDTSGSDFVIDSGLSHQFYIRVSDDLGNRLTPGTSVKISADVGAADSVEITLPDGTYGGTDYYITWSNNLDCSDEGGFEDGELTVEVSGDNGAITLSIGRLLEVPICPTE
jgi:photosystem II stability/assembly factor-like uncharacterized protein